MGNLRFKNSLSRTCPKKGCCTLTPLVGSSVILRRQLAILHGTLGLMGNYPPPRGCTPSYAKKTATWAGRPPTLSLCGRVSSCPYYFLIQGIQITTNNGRPLEDPVRAAFTAPSGGPGLPSTLPPFFSLSKPPFAQHLINAACFGTKQLTCFLGGVRSRLPFRLPCAASATS